MDQIEEIDHDQSQGKPLMSRPIDPIVIQACDNETVAVNTCQVLARVCMVHECVEGFVETWLTPDNARKLATQIVRAADSIRPARSSGLPAKPPRQWEPRVRQADVWQLTPDELALYLRIAYHASPPRYLCITSTATLCDSCLSDKKVRAAKKTLEKKKRIEIKRRFNQTDQIKLIKPVLDRSDVYVPKDVVLALRPPELAIYCRIADRDRGTGCKAQNKELAIKVCTVRQVANILAKLESNGLIRRYEIDGKRFISSSAYGFKAHAAHLAELEKRAADACNLG